MSDKKDLNYLLDIIQLEESGEEKNDQEKIKISFSGFLNKNDSISKVNLNLSYLFSKDSFYNTNIIPLEKEGVYDNYYECISNNINKNLRELDFTITHTEEPIFKVPKNSHWIMFQNYGYGSMPIHWKENLRDYIDQIWVSSNYEKECFVNSGIPENSIEVIPTCVDTSFFNPDIEKIDLGTEKKKVLLYKGDLSINSGFDLLLRAYTEEFVKEEDIILVVLTEKENITEDKKELFSSLNNNPENPQIIFIENPNEQKKLANIYKSVSFFVYPFRKDSYCLDLLESMACGTPVITIDQGVSTEYCNKENSILVKSERVYQKEKEINNIQTISNPFWYEVDLLSLKVSLRNAFNMSDEDHKELSSNASKTISNNFTIVKLNEKIKNILLKLKETPIKQFETLEINKKILDGLNTLNTGDYQNAKSIFEEALNISNENSKINFYLGVLELQNNNLTKSLKYLTKAFEHETNNDDISNYLGVLLYKLNEFYYSKLLFEYTLEINSEHTGAIESLKALSQINIDNTNSNLDPEIKQVFDFKFKNQILKKNHSLSVCIIAKNEKRHITKAIKSVKKVADEIIVLDTGSTDGTPELAIKEGADVYFSSWENSFGKARNEVKKYASKDWILMLDADEVLSEESVDKLRDLLPQLDKNKFYCPKILNILDKMAEKEIIEHYLERLIPNDENIIYQRDIHEMPVKVDGSKIETEIIPYIQILHYGYQNKEFTEKNKTIRNDNILTEMFNKDKNDPINTFYLALSLKDQKEYKQSLEYSYLTIQNINNTPHQHLLSLIQINVLECLIYEEKIDEALEKAKEYNDTLKERPDYYFLLGTIYFKKEDYSLAKENFEKAISQRNKDDVVELDRGTVGWKSLLYISQCYKKANDLLKSNIYIKRALKDSPNNLKLKLELFDNYILLKEDKLIESTLFSLIPYLDESNSLMVLNTIFNYYSESNNIDSIYNILEFFRKKKININNKNLFDNLANKLIELYNFVLSKKENFNASHYSIACCLDYLGKTDEAETIFSNLYKDDDLEVDSLHNMASLAFKKNDLEKAEELYKQVLDTDEFHIESYISLIKLKLLKHKTNEAEELLNKLSNIDPDNTELSYLEFELARDKGDKKLASDMYASMLSNFIN